MPMFDVDLAPRRPSDLQSVGGSSCYLSAGVEEFRPTPTRFPDGLVGT